ncbi:hypothetical protein [Bradyrhizobium paxllaeri]|uniref:hypothetical protein n=1 Tax=Bradyrhizobium paxllaeri TaxID=190148 RepID=UPI003D31B431
MAAGRSGQTIAADGSTRIYGHPQLRNLAGKVAIQRGPLIYCLEEADNGTELHNVWLPAESRFSLIEGTGLFSDKIAAG